MKSTGITRRIDELGRIVIPKEIRRNLGIRDGELLEICLSDEGIFLKKHSYIYNFADIGSKLCKILSDITGELSLITDREKVIVSNNEILEGKLINHELVNLIDNRESLYTDYEKSINFGSELVNGYVSICPIISQTDSLGLVIIISKEENDYKSITKLIASILAEKLDIS